MAVPEKKLKVDSRGRINIKQLSSEKVTSYRAHLEKDGVIVLRPVVDVELHPEEAWLFEKPKALEGVLEGIEDSKAGRVSELEEDFWDDIESA